MEKLWRCPIRGGNWFLSVPSARRVTRGGDLDRLGVVISIHALREEGDLPIFCGRCSILSISIHALREEGDSTSMLLANAFFLFLSTPSARRATSHLLPDVQRLQDFYPRPPRGGRRALCFRRYSTGLISIHALREEGDSGHTGILLAQANFYPRPPRGGRHDYGNNTAQIVEFLSTPSARRATCNNS